jgi:hypothetical protein
MPRSSIVMSSAWYKFDLITGGLVDVKEMMVTQYFCRFIADIHIERIRI